MTKQQNLVAQLEDKYEEFLEQFEDKRDGMIHILSSLLISAQDEYEVSKKIWKVSK